MSPDSSVPPAIPRSRGSRLAWLWVVVLPVAGAFAGLLAAAVIAYITPKKFESVAVVQVTPVVLTQPEETTPERSSFVLDAARFQALLVSDGFLQRVAEEQGFTTRWQMDPATAARHMRGAVSTDVIAGTDLVRIRVRHTNAQDARAVAGALVESFMEQEQERAMMRGRERLAVVDDELRELEMLVDRLRERVETIRADGSGDLAGATRDHGNAEAMLQEMKLRFSTERIALKLPKTPLTLHEAPKIGRAPVSPKVGLMILQGALVGGGAGLVLGLIVFLLIGRRPTRSGAA